MVYEQLTHEQVCVHMALHGWVPYAATGSLPYIDLILGNDFLGRVLYIDNRGVASIRMYELTVAADMKGHYKDIAWSDVPPHMLMAYYFYVEKPSDEYRAHLRYWAEQTGVMPNIRLPMVLSN